MADSTISVRASDEVKAKFQAICAEEQGIKSGDLLEKLISAYEFSKQTAQSANKKRFEEFDQIINALQIKFRDAVIAIDASADRALNLGLVERFNFGLPPRFNLSLATRFNFGLSYVI